MSNRGGKTNMHKLRAGGVLVVSVIGFGVILYRNYDTDPKNTLAFNLILLFASILVTEKVADFFGAFQEDYESVRRDKFFSDLPLYLSETHDIVCFRSRPDALLHCIRSAERDNLIHIRNTSCRFNLQPTAESGKSRSEQDTVYREWIKARHEAVERGPQLTEIISKYLTANDPVRRYVNEIRKISTRYRFHKIDDVNKMGNPPALPG